MAFPCLWSQETRRPCEGLFSREYSLLLDIITTATSRADCVTFRLCRQVRIRDGHDDPGLAGQSGVVRSVTGSMCSLFLPDEDRVVNMMADQLEPVRPQRVDRVKVILGQSPPAGTALGACASTRLGSWDSLAGCWGLLG